MNFFITGDGSVKSDVNLEFITPSGSHGANFAADGQTLMESLSIAQKIFGRIKHGKIDFVLIGLAPDVLFQGGDVDKNLNAFGEYIKLCVDNGAKPVCVIFPVAPKVRESYRKNFVEPLRSILAALKKLYDFEFVDLFEFLMPEKAFVDERSLKFGSAPFMSVILTFELYKKKIIPYEEFCRMSYSYFNELSYAVDKNKFHSLMKEVFQSTVTELRRKDKIKIAFVTDHAAMWCGDELYNLFARNPRFETTIFLCRSLESTLDDACHDFEQLKSRGLNVVGVFDLSEETPPQDIVIFLRPYLVTLSKNFQLNTTTPQTLWINIPYVFKSTTMKIDIQAPIQRLAWKNFFETTQALKIFDENCSIGIPRGLVSGFPKLDVFFEDVGKFSFPWKMTHPDAKKIIWAPHWSFEKGEDVSIFLSTFNHNYKFMYEFAKSHPETSWVVKPHPRLSYSAVKIGLFPSVETFEDYLQAWNDLPNAQVFTGGYYQSIFITSDGMIQDCGSFIGEYQYTHKPMIYLTREDATEFSELGKKILEVSYCVDGRDFDGIAALMQKVFIEGNDPLKDARQKLFDELLNYRRANGMSASEYIFHSVADELMGER